MCALRSDELQRIFEKLDKNGNGLVTLDELGWLLEKIGLHVSTDELEVLVGKTSLDLLDFVFFYDNVVRKNISDKNKKIEGEEEEEELEKDLGKAFKVFDLNGDGFISCEELQKVLGRLGLWDEQCGQDCESMIKVYDDNDDGKLDFEEFKNMMSFPSNS